MGFKSGKGNAYHQLAAKLKAAEDQLAFERERPTLERFANELGKAMLVQLASIPYKDWPQFAKNTFAYIETTAPTAAWAYKQRLPK